MTGAVLLEVGAERRRQELKWGEQNHEPTGWLPILVEEVGEVAKAIMERTNTREELVHVAAVAVAAIESIDRNSK